MNSKAFIVLGMHRSATSLVAGGLQQMDVHVGDRLLGPTRNNPKGFFENRDFYELNKDILRAAGGNWKRPPAHEKILAVGDLFKDRIRNTIQRSERPLWGFKDPRTTLTIQLYVPYLQNPHYITCFRSPDEVAKSLVRRGDTSYEQGYDLAIEYNRRLIDFLQLAHCK